MINRDNYQAARRWLEFQADVKQVNSATLKVRRAQLRHILEWADETPFLNAAKIKPTLPRYLQTADANHDGVALAASTQTRICQTAKRFFTWLRMTDREAARAITEQWLATLEPVRADHSVMREHRAYTLDQVRELIALPGEDLVTRRDRAAVALLFLSGMRAGAFVTLKVNCLDVAGRRVMQWPERGVKTKNRKAATTFLLEIADLLAVVVEWDSFVRARLPETALWYATISSDGTQLTGGSTAETWRQHHLARGLRRLCALAGVPYLSMHKLRHGHAVYALSGAATVADLKAVSQNLMHGSLTITDQIYGVLGGDDVAARIRGVSGGKVEVAAGASEDALLDKLAAKLLAKLEGAQTR